MNFFFSHLPAPPDEKWANELTRALEDSFTSIFKDLRYGTATHRVLTSAPSESEVEEGEVVFVDSGSGTLELYTKLNGTLRHASLT